MNRPIHARNLLPILSTCLLSAGSQLAAEDLKLLPREETLPVEEGVGTPSLVFPAPPDKVRYTPPLGWNWDRTAEGIRLSPPKGENLHLLIRATRPKSAPPPGDSPEAIQTYTSTVRADLPENATNIEAMPPNPRFARIDGADVLEIQHTYTVGGLPMRRADLFFDRKGQVIRFSLIAPADRFEASHAAVRRSLYTWQTE